MEEKIDFCLFLFGLGWLGIGFFEALLSNKKKKYTSSWLMILTIVLWPIYTGKDK